MLRRSLLKAAAALPAASLFGADSFDVAAEERPRVLRGAAKYLNEPPITVTRPRARRAAPAASTIISRKATIGGPIRRIPMVPISSATA